MMIQGEDGRDTLLSEFCLCRLKRMSVVILSWLQLYVGTLLLGGVVVLMLEVGFVLNS